MFFFCETCRRLTHHQNEFKRESITRLPIFPGVKGCAIFSSEILRLDACLLMLRHDEMVMDFWWAATQLDASLIWKVKLKMILFFSRENATQNKVTFSTAAVKKYTHEWCSWWFISFHSLSRSNGHLDTKWFSRFKNQMNSGVVGNKNGF